jgi:voltage-gated sodium channel
MSALCLRLSESPGFKNFITAVILLAGVLVGLETSPQLVQRHGTFFHFLDQAILTIFVLEILIKMAACGRHPWRYFLDGWNVFDFTIVAVCLLPLHAEFAAVLRLARILRVLRLVTVLPRLQLLVGTLLKSIPSMGYVGLLLSLLFYVYGVCGVFFFGSADPKNFGTLGDALLTLFGVITLEGWTELMYGLLEPDSAVPKAKVILYFLSFVLLGTMVMLNLFIGVIMNSMEEVQQEKAIAHLTTSASEDDLADLEAELDRLKTRVRAARDRLRHQH